jgi:hypothetical protein
MSSNHSTSAAKEVDPSKTIQSFEALKCLPPIHHHQSLLKHYDHMCGLDASCVNLDDDAQGPI